MRRITVFKLLFLIFALHIFAAELNNPVYTLKIYFDTKETDNSIKKFPKGTARFLREISKTLNEKLLQFFLSQNIHLYLKRGLASDYTVLYTFPKAYIQAISLKEQESDNFIKYSYGYKISVDVALYIFKTSSNPQLVCYKVFSFKRYYPPSSQYLPVFTSLSEGIAEIFFLQMKSVLKNFIGKEKEKLEYYRNIGK